MNKIEKLFKKISPSDRKKLLILTERLLVKDLKGLKIKKIVNSSFYRLRSGRFRIIFHYENKEIVIDSIKFRKEDTYKRVK